MYRTLCRKYQRNLISLRIMLRFGIIRPMLALDPVVRRAGLCRLESYRRDPRRVCFGPVHPKIEPLPLRWKNPDLRGGAYVKFFRESVI